MGGGRGPGAEGKGEEAEHGRFWRWVLCDGVMEPTCPYRPIYTTECTPPGVDPDVNGGPWVTVMCRWRSFGCDRRSIWGDISVAAGRGGNLLLAFHFIVNLKLL